MTIARYARAHCPRCRGTGVVTYVATESLGGKETRRWTYEAECPWCTGAQLWTATEREGRV